MRKQDECEADKTQQATDDRAMIVLFARIFEVVCPDKMPPRDVPPKFKALFMGSNMTSVLKQMILSEPRTIKSSTLANKYGIPERSVRHIRGEAEIVD